MAFVLFYLMFMILKEDNKCLLNAILALKRRNFVSFCAHSGLLFDFYQQILVQNYHNYKYLYYLCTDF